MYDILFVIGMLLVIIFVITLICIAVAIWSYVKVKTVYGDDKCYQELPAITRVIYDKDSSKYQGYPCRCGYRFDEVLSDNKKNDDHTMFCCESCHDLFIVYPVKKERK